jgi:hypothetical protein
LAGPRINRIWTATISILSPHRQVFPAGELITKIDEQIADRKLILKS